MSLSSCEPPRLPIAPAGESSTGQRAIIAMSWSRISAMPCGPSRSPDNSPRKYAAGTAAVTTPAKRPSGAL